MLELFSAAVFQDHLALLVRALVFFAPLFVLFYLRKKHEFVAVVAGNLQNLNKLFEDVGTGPDSKLARALKRTALRPLGDASLAEKFPAIVAFHWVIWNLEANTADERVLQFLMHLAIKNPLDIVAARLEGMVGLRLVLKWFEWLWILGLIKIN